MEIIKVNYVPERIKYILFNDIKKVVLENNGIIFGGYVRDLIISDHYKSIYNSCNTYNIHHFWNRMYHPETAARTLVAKDMDICMYSEEGVSNFINSLQNIFNDNVGYSNVSSSDITITRDACYFNIPIKMHKKINYKITIGKIPYVHSGIELSFDFDIIVPRKSNVQPPFFKVDLLSNVFILSKHGVVMSNHTGTLIDKMSILNKQKISSLIMADVIEFKTQFCMRNYRDRYVSGNYNYNSKVFERINKMLFRNFKWDITNLPFVMSNYKRNYNNSNNNCCICLANFKNNDRIVKMYIDNSTKTEKICSNMSIAHDKCLFKYLQTQLDTEKEEGISNADPFEFRCPLRNAINFKLCSDNIDKIICEKMNS
jgi:hypothetical protein